MSVPAQGISVTPHGMPVAAAAGDPCTLSVAGVGLNATPTSTGPFAESFGSAVLDMATKLATNEAEAVAGPVGGMIIGWALSNLFGSGGGQPVDDPTADRLDDLTAQMREVRAQLDQITAQLAALSSLIKDSTYQTEIANLESTHVAPLLDLWRRHCAVVSHHITDPRTLDQLATDILSGAGTHATAIATAFTGNPATQSVPLPAMFTEAVRGLGELAAHPFDDRQVYDDVVNPYTDHFVALVVMAMTMETEAHHLRADGLAGSSIDYYWDLIRRTTQAGGYPVSSASVLTQYGTPDIAWSLAPLAATASFASKDATANLGATDPVQYALATFGSFYRKKYSFAAGDTVDHFMVGWASPTPASYAPALAAGNALTPFPLTWSLPTDAQFRSLVAGSTGSPVDRMRSLGFSGLDASRPSSTRLLYTSDATIDGYLDAVTGAYVCISEHGCTPTDGAILAVAPLTDYLGSGNYRGIPTAPGSAWLGARWPANPLDQASGGLLGGARAAEPVTARVTFGYRSSRLGASQKRALRRLVAGIPYGAHVTTSLTGLVRGSGATRADRALARARTRAVGRYLVTLGVARHMDLRAAATRLTTPRARAVKVTLTTTHEPPPPAPLPPPPAPRPDFGPVRDR